MPQVRFATRSAVVLVAALVQVAFACGRAEPTAGTTTCPAGQRFINGSCLPTCNRDQDCVAGARCFTVDQGGPVCLSPDDGGTNACTFLGDDTKCVGVGLDERSSGRYIVTQPYSSDPPSADLTNTTHFDDPTFSGASGYDASAGCVGNAQWMFAPAVGSPACAVAHPVKRCRVTVVSGVPDFGTVHRCVIVDGSTIDRVNL